MYDRRGLNDDGSDEKHEKQLNVRASVLVFQDWFTLKKNADDDDNGTSNEMDGWLNGLDWNNNSFIVKNFENF